VKLEKAVSINSDIETMFNALEVVRLWLCKTSFVASHEREEVNYRAKNTVDVDSIAGLKEALNILSGSEKEYVDTKSTTAVVGALKKTVKKIEERCLPHVNRASSKSPTFRQSHTN